MSSINQSELEHILKLSKIHASEDELMTFKQDLNNALKLFDRIHCTKSNTSAMVSPTHNNRRFRDDFPESKNNQPLCKKFAPLFRQGHFIVPQVVD